MIKILFKRIGVVLFLTLLFATELFAQDPEFTQFYANPLYLNPAFAGTAHCPRVSLNYRNQWPGISGSFITNSISYDQHIDALAGGIGLLVMHDKAGEGTISTTSISGIYSYQLPVTRTFSLKAGIQATWAQKKLDWSKLTFGDQIDPRRGFIYDSKEIQRDQPASYVDFTAGILGFSEKYFGGVSVSHLTEPNESVIEGASPLPMKFTFHAGAIIPLDGKGEEASISPNVLVQLQENFTQINFGMYYNKGPIVAGLWYRNSDAFIALLGFQTGIMKFGYSYDITVSKLTKTAGSHELSLGFVFDCKPRRRRFRTISCPSF